MLKFTASICILFLLAGVSVGAPFSISQRQFSAGTPQELQDAYNSAMNSIEQDVNSGIVNATSRTDLLQAVARASTSGTSSIVTDRASEPTKLTAGLGFQGSVYLNGRSFTKAFDSPQTNTLPDSGASVGMTLLVGVPGTGLGFLPDAGWLRKDRMMLFANLMHLSTQVSSYNVSVFNIGLNGYYRLTERYGNPWIASWGGLTVGTGLNFSSFTLSVRGRLEKTSTQAVGAPTNGTATAQVAMDYDLGLRTIDVFVPFEAATHVTLLYILTLYGGGAIDVNLGSTGLRGGATGPVTGTSSSGAGEVFTASAALDLEEGGLGASPSLLVARAFAGLQLNLWALKIGADYTLLSHGAQSVAVFLRAAL